MSSESNVNSITETQTVYNCSYFYNYARTVGHAGYCIISSAIGPPASELKRACERVIYFIKFNWSKLISGGAAWGVIIAGIGLMYGFQATALPLSTGLACGMGFGFLSGIIVVNLFHSHAKANEKYNTLWKMLNEWINSRDSGTRSIVLSIAVTVILAAAVVFPFLIGILLGVILGNHLSTKMGLGENLGSPQDTKKAIDEKIGALKEKLAELETLAKAYQKE